MSALSTATPARPAAQAVGLVKRYGEGQATVRAVDGIDVEVARGSFTAIMGPSGSGKSTLMHCLAGLDRPTEGTIEIGGQDITKMGDKELTLLRRSHIGFVFQAFNLISELNIVDNVQVPLFYQGVPRSERDRSYARGEWKPVQGSVQ
jgi:putative ABC transport system ATP-binding protein